MLLKEPEEASKNWTSKYEKPGNVCQVLPMVYESNKPWKKSFICKVLH